MRQGSVQPDVREGTAFWPAGFSGWIRIGIVYARTTRHLATQLRPFDLTVAQFDALAHLYVEDGITQQQLAERLVVTKGNVTGLVNRLAKRKLVERHDDPDDRRANRVVLTRAGRAVAKKALAMQAELVEEMMARLTASEQKRLAKYLGRLAQHFEEPAPDA